MLRRRQHNRQRGDPSPSCHQSSSSTRRRPDDRTSAAFPKGVHNDRIEASREPCSAYADRSDRNGCDSANTVEIGGQIIKRHGVGGRTREVDYAYRTCNARNTLDQSGYSLSRFESENVEWPMKCDDSGSAVHYWRPCDGSWMRAGHRVRGSSSIRATAENGCPASAGRD